MEQLSNVTRRLNLIFRIRGTGTCRKGVWMQVAGVLLPVLFLIPSGAREPYNPPNNVNGRQAFLEKIAIKKVSIRFLRILAGIEFPSLRSGSKEKLAPNLTSYPTIAWRAD
jgi:hypothetical protein